MPEIQLPTYAQLTEVLAELGVIDGEVINIKTLVNAIIANNLGTPSIAASNSTSALAHSKLNYLLSNGIGTPASAANNSTAANAHAKLNWVITNLINLLDSAPFELDATMLANTLSTGSIRTIPIIKAEIKIEDTPSANTVATVTGSGKILAIVGTGRIIIDNGPIISMPSEGGYTNIKFKTGFKITRAGTSATPYAVYVLQ